MVTYLRSLLRAKAPGDESFGDLIVGRISRLTPTINCLQTNAARGAQCNEAIDQFARHDAGK